MSQSLRHRSRRAGEEDHSNSTLHEEESSNHSNGDQNDMAYTRQRPLIAQAVQRNNSNSVPLSGRRMISRDRNKILVVLAITVIYTTVLYRSGQSSSLFFS